MKKVRGTTKASVSGLVERYKDILQENYGDQENELMAILESLKDKQSDLKKINKDIVELLSEDESENEVTQSDKIDMNLVYKMTWLGIQNDMTWYIKWHDLVYKMIWLGIQNISKKLKLK